jgi:hypothetical protein
MGFQVSLFIGNGQPGQDRFSAWYVAKPVKSISQGNLSDFHVCEVHPKGQTL